MEPDAGARLLGEHRTGRATTAASLRHRHVQLLVGGEEERVSEIPLILPLGSGLINVIGSMEGARASVPAAAAGIVGSV
jgi:hypothetical protein